MDSNSPKGLLGKGVLVRVDQWNGCYNESSEPCDPGLDGVFKFRCNIVSLVQAHISINDDLDRAYYEGSSSPKPQLSNPLNITVGFDESLNFSSEFWFVKRVQ